MATARRSMRKGEITITLDPVEARYLYSLLGHHTPWASPMRSLFNALDRSPVGVERDIPKLWEWQPKRRPLSPILDHEDDK